jgi:hypothetical protein
VCHVHRAQDWTSFTKDGFNKLDVVVVLIDVVLMGIADLVPPSASGLARSLRGLRVLRLLRVLRAAKAISKIKTAFGGKEKGDDWELPRRYSHTPDAKLETMLQMVGVLSEITAFSRDFHLSQMLAMFKAGFY